MFRSTCLGFFYQASLCFVPLFCFMLMLGSHVHMLVMRCSDLCVYVLYAMLYAYVLGFMFHHVYMLIFYMFMHTLLCLYV